ncbi:hypothetical protein KZZ52_45395 [Dactylosporangium sp. AC04546]|uniref:hypothetical protein n=1 Tax=Dactylosporangium sp. AC04546 TaxID=2862460 RepID=UPI001EE07C41|nr:hypothetical protein [Dactylosporangium sp. AC04546]WVK81152.1 hypothetical protein KZZ52_45395 [Dactylosporangium sp. AC04546]
MSLPLPVEHDGLVTAVAAGLLRDREVVVTGDESGAVRWWDAATGALVGRAGEDLPGPVRGVAIGDAGSATLVAALDGDGFLTAWDAGTTAGPREISCLRGADFGPYFLPHRGRPAIVVATSWAVRAVDAVTGHSEELGDVRGRIGRPPDYYDERDGHEAGMSRFAAAVVGGEPVWATSDTFSQYVWSGGRVRCTLTGGPDLEGTALALGTVHGRAVVVNTDGAHSVWLHDAGSGAAVAGPLTGCAGEIVGVGLAPGAVVAASRDGAVRRWALDGGRPGGTRREPAVARLPGEPAALAVSPLTGRAWTAVGTTVVAT